jgi:hypothetical protein
VDPCRDKLYSRDKPEDEPLIYCVIIIKHVCPPGCVAHLPTGVTMREASTTSQRKKKRRSSRVALFRKGDRSYHQNTYLELGDCNYGLDVWTRAQRSSARYGRNGFGVNIRSVLVRTSACANTLRLACCCRRCQSFKGLVLAVIALLYIRLLMCAIPYSVGDLT